MFIFVVNLYSMKYIIGSIILLLGIGCDSFNNEKSTSYFGGEIINPKGDYVVFLKEDKVIDTLKLDKNNRFLKEFPSLKEGLYTFKHGAEFQYVYMQPTDSILVRLNTWDFDESLVFSGKGSSKNEFLINLFLQNQQEDRSMFKYFNLDEKQFEAKIDSLIQIKTAIYKEFANASTEDSKGFNKLINVAIYYPLYRLKEIYPYYHSKFNHLKKPPVISEEFYDFRKKINLNEKELVSFYPYQNYVVSYLYHLSYDNFNEESDYNLTVNLLNNVVKHIKLEDFKNTLLKRIVVNDFLKSESTCQLKDDILTIFTENCSNINYVTQVQSLVSDSKKIKNKSPLNNFEITSQNNETLEITDVIKNKNSVIYFWSTKYMSVDYLVNRINYLEANFPTINFIGINMQTVSFLGNEPNLKKLNKQKQFNLPSNSSAHQFLASGYPRLIIVDKNGVVENGFTYLGAKSLNRELQNLK